MNTAPQEPILAVQNVGKTFGHVQALHDVSFDLHPGEIVALLGDNGAGKSTLIKILTGVYGKDTGTLIIDGEDRRFHSPGEAVDAGVAAVYQDLALVDAREVAANIFLGREFHRGPFVDRKRMRLEAKAALARLSVQLPSIKVDVGSLSGGQRQAVAVARAIVQGARIVVMDEPTAALGVAKSEQVLSVARQLAANGVGVIIVSHNLQQIWDVADRFVVLYLGEVAGIRDKAETTLDEVVSLIVRGKPATTSR